MEDLTIQIKPVDQFKSTAEEFTNYIAFCVLFDAYTDIWDRYDCGVSEDSGDIEGSIMARCMKTGEDDNELLEMLDRKLALFGYTH